MKKINPIKRLWKLIEPDKKDIINIYIFAIFNGVIALSLPLGIQSIINLIQGGEVNSSWIVLIVIVLVGIGLSGAMQIYQLRITENIEQKIFTRSAFEFVYRIPRIKMEALYKHYAPELMNRFFDTISLQKGLSKLLLDTSSSALQVIFGLILLSLYHPFFIIFSLILVLLVYAIFKFTAPLGLRTSIKESSHKYKVAHWIEELARTSSTFKLAGKTNFPMTKTDENVTYYLKERENHFKVLVWQYALLIAFKVIVAAGLLIIGGLLVMDQAMNIGQFVAAEIIIIMILASVEKLILSLETVYDILTSLEKIGQVVDLELENNKGDIIKDNKEGFEIKFNNVSFTYPDEPNLIFENLSFTIESNERVLISGNNGSGKSTLLQLISGLYSPISGQLFYNGLSYQNLNLQELRLSIGDSLNDEQIFEGTIAENITIGRDKATKENINWAVKNLLIEDFINSLPEGLNTMLEPEGKKLPKSIIKKILLARSIVDKPKLVLLEDAFDGINKKEQLEIIKFLTNPENFWTLIMVNSEFSLREYITKEIILSNGKIENILSVKS